MAQYLIVKFEVCSDQNECDGNRVPMFMTDDWDRDRPEDYDFEVYKLEDDRTFRFIGGSNLGNYDAEQVLPAKSEGMALTVWGDDIESTIMEFPGLTANDPVPPEVMAFFADLRQKFGDNILEDEDEFSGDLKYYNAISLTDLLNDKVYLYGHYRDRYYDITW